MLEIVALSTLWVVVVALGYRFLRNARFAAQLRERTIRRTRPPRSELHKYHAVTIVRGGSACPGSSDLGGRRFLSNEAPPLPLPGCSIRPCQCRYIHHADRRGEDRRFPFGVRRRGESTVKDERRRGDRRKGSDLVFG